MVMESKLFYENCNLTSNPFRSNAVFLGDDPRIAIWAGNLSEKVQLEKFLSRSRAEQVGNTSLLLLYGEFGTGKSHALLWSVDFLRKQTVGGKSNAYYIPTLRKDKGKLSFASAFIDDLIGKSTLLDDLIQFKRFLVKLIDEYENEPEDQVIRKLIPPIDLHKFAIQLYHAEQDSLAEVIAPKGLNEYQAIITFTNIVNLFVYPIKVKGEVIRFRQSVHLMIDEMDVLRQSSAKELIGANDLIRHLYDFCPNCFGLVLAVSAEQELLTSMFADYILTRIHRQISFPLFDRDTAVSFAIDIMNASRKDKETTAKCGAFPFEKLALEAIMNELRSRSPRKVVQVMEQVIEELRIADVDPSKTIFTVKIIEDKNILNEIL